MVAQLLAIALFVLWAFSIGNISQQYLRLGMSKWRMIAWTIVAGWAPMLGFLAYVGLSRLLHDVIWRNPPHVAERIELWLAMAVIGVIWLALLGGSIAWVTRRKSFPVTAAVGIACLLATLGIMWGIGVDSRVAAMICGSTLVLSQWIVVLQLQKHSKRVASGEACRKCGYSRSGLDPQAACPECGMTPRL